MFNDVKLIVCCDASYGIGYQNVLPWNIPEEMKLFRKKTVANSNNCVIMGKNTFHSIPKKYFPLASRVNCIITTSEPDTKETKNTYICRNMDEVFKFIEQTQFEEYWVIGGKMIYDLFLKANRVKEVHMSILNKTYTCDTWFDCSWMNDFMETESTQFEEFTCKVFKKK
jgi:dihydrofolate reductase